MSENNTDDAYIVYHEVVEGAQFVCRGTAQPSNETIEVTVFGLRRLFEVVDQAQELCFHVIHEHPELFKTDLRLKECVMECMRSSSTILCEDAVVMSGLFVVDGVLVEHTDDEVREAGIPPWVKERSTR